MTANQRYRKALPGTDLEYYDARQACEDIKPGSYDKLPYTSRILAENLVNRADKVDLPTLQSWLGQLIEGKQEIDFPWYPARVVCHDILGQTALVDLAGFLRPRRRIRQMRQPRALYARIQSVPTRYRWQ